MGTFFILVGAACQRVEPDSGVDDNRLWKICKSLDDNAEGLAKLAEANASKDSIEVLDIGLNDDGRTLYIIGTKEGSSIELQSGIAGPELSMAAEGDVFFWTIDGSVVTDAAGNRISVTDRARMLSFHIHDGALRCLAGDEVVGEYDASKQRVPRRDVSLDFDTDDRRFNFALSSGSAVSIPATAGFPNVEEAEPTFYRDIFLDAGVALTSRNSLAAADYLHLSLEPMIYPQFDATSELIEMQKSIIAGTPEDTNGRLLYPDGQPRYRLLFINGGDSRVHGESLGKAALDNMRAFVANGGSYVGTCAGAFIASNGYDGRVDYPYYLSVWPGMMQHTGLNNTHSGMFIERNSPLLNYSSFGGDSYIDNIRHNGGGYPVNFPKGTEILARYDYPDNTTVHYKPSIWAYKATESSGRVVLTGSHPEEVTDGERRDLTAAMIQYALEGKGNNTIKGFLNSGVARVMDKSTEDHDPAHTRIGDMQTHYFAAYIPSEAGDVGVNLQSPSGCDMVLKMSYLSSTDPAEFISRDPGARQQLYFDSLKEGFWLISVQCTRTVTVKDTEYGQSYTGNTGILNGIPYTVSISWNSK